jgi:glucokinase
MTVSKAVIVGVDLGGTQVRAGRVRAGELERHEARRISSRERQEVVLAEVFQVIDQVFDEEVAGIGCGVPSLVDAGSGIVRSVVNIPSWREVRLKDELESRYNVPATIDNDANAFAVGELHFGKGRGHRTMAGMTLGTGLGTGVIIDGRLYRGANGGAGEIGLLPYREHTIEQYCGGGFFQGKGVDGEEVFRRAQDGDPEALRIYHEYGFELGFAVLAVLYAYDPELIVFGGSISRAFPLFESGMRERLAAYAYPHALTRLEITYSEIQHAAILGAAALSLDSMPSPPPRETR